MTCDRVQAELSASLDEGGALSPRAARHLSGCEDCEAFRTQTIDLSERYAREVRAGIGRLRGTDPAAPPRGPRRRPGLLSAALAAACLLGCWGLVPGSPAPRVAPDVDRTPVPAGPPASRARLFESPELFDREEVSFLFEREALPVRLDQDLLPVRAELSEIRLPPSLRF
jgi:hypothetical protein